MKEEMQKKLFCKIVLVTFFVAECTFNVRECYSNIYNIVLLCQILKNWRNKSFKIQKGGEREGKGLKKVEAKIYTLSTYLSARSK